MNAAISRLIVAMVIGFGWGGGAEGGGNPGLVCFVDAAERIKTNPVYALGKDGLLYPVAVDARLKFWGPRWPVEVQYWGDRYGRPIRGKEKDFMRAKGPAITTASKGMEVFVDPVAEARRNAPQEIADKRMMDAIRRFEAARGKPSQLSIGHKTTNTVVMVGVGGHINVQMTPTGDVDAADYDRAAKTMKKMERDKVFMEKIEKRLIEDDDEDSDGQ